MWQVAPLGPLPLSVVAADSEKATEPLLQRLGAPPQTPACGQTGQLRSGLSGETVSVAGPAWAEPW